MLLHDVGNDPTEIDALLGNPPAFFADLARSLYSLLRLCGPGAGPAAASDDLASPEEAAALRAAFAHTCGNGRDAFLGPRLSSAARAVLQGALPVVNLPDWQLPFPPGDGGGWDMWRRRLSVASTAVLDRVELDGLFVRCPRTVNETI